MQHLNAIYVAYIDEKNQFIKLHNRKKINSSFELFIFFIKFYAQ